MYQIREEELEMLYQVKGIINPPPPNIPKWLLLQILSVDPSLTKKYV
jgi:hypothetical protein